MQDFKEFNNSSSKSLERRIGNFDVQSQVNRSPDSGDVYGMKKKPSPVSIKRYYWNDVGGTGLVISLWHNPKWYYNDFKMPESVAVTYTNNEL